MLTRTQLVTVVKLITGRPTLCLDRSLSVSLSAIVIVNSRFLERPIKRIRGNQLIHRRLTITKSIDSGQNPESRAGRQSDGYACWIVFGVETGREVCGRS